MANFEAFRRAISSSSNLLFLKSDIGMVYIHRFLNFFPLYIFQIAERMAMIDWSDPEVGKMVEQTFTLGNHNSLCLAHGREPIIPVRLTLQK